MIYNERIQNLAELLFFSSMPAVVVFGSYCVYHHLTICDCY